MIRSIRESKGLTQEALAAAAGIRVATLSEIENGKGNPTLRTLEALTGAMGCSLLDAFEPSPTEPSERDMLNAFRVLDEEEKRAILQLVLLRKRVAP